MRNNYRERSHARHSLGGSTNTHTHTHTRIHVCVCIDIYTHTRARTVCQQSVLTTSSKAQALTVQTCGVHVVFLAHMSNFRALVAKLLFVCLCYHQTPMIVCMGIIFQDRWRLSFGTGECKKQRGGTETRSLETGPRRFGIVKATDSCPYCACYMNIFSCTLYPHSEWQTPVPGVVAETIRSVHCCMLSD